MSNPPTILDKQAAAADSAQLETEVAHHQRQAKIYVASKFVHDFRELEERIQEANDPELDIKLMNLRMKVAGWDSTKQQDKQDQIMINFSIDLGDGPEQGITMSARVPTTTPTDVTDIESTEVLLGAFSSLDTDNL